METRGGKKANPEQQRHVSSGGKGKVKAPTKAGQDLLFLSLSMTMKLMLHSHN